MLKLIVSNRAELLADALAEELRARPLPLLEPELVLVPASSTARWLQLRLAERLGIVCQTRFPLPAAYVWSLFGTLLPQVPRSSPFATDTLVWRLFRLLGRLPDEADFDPVRRPAGHRHGEFDRASRDRCARPRRRGNRFVRHRSSEAADGDQGEQ